MQTLKTIDLCKSRPITPLGPSLIYEYLLYVDARKSKTNMKHSLTLNLYNLVLTFYVCLKQLTDLSLEKIAPERCMLSVVSNSFLFIKQCEITDWRQFSPIL